MSEKRKSTSSRTIVAAIDIGTTYSGYAYSYKADWTKVFINRWEGGQLVTHKAPTALLLNPDKSFNSFGYEAEKEYEYLADEDPSYKEYYFFHRFKMTQYTGFTKRVHREIKCKDENGREVKAMDVFTHSIRYLKDKLLQELCLYELSSRVDDRTFVLTVPAIWDDTAKMFMREAAIGAGIPGDQLEIALEPEAASIYCHLMHLDETQRDNTTNSFIREPGVKYMVVDLGGGMADITVHQLQENNTLAELVPASCGEWGGTRVDKAYRQFLEDIFGSSVLEKFESDPDNIIDYYEFWQYFEVKKREHRNCETSKKISLVIPLALIDIVKEQMRIKGNSFEIMKTCLRESKYCDTGIHVYSKAGKLMLPIEFFETFFSPAINELVDHFSKMFRELDLTDVKTILLVGGFSECKLMRDRLKRHFGNTKQLVFPDEASLAVLKGAVYFGHCKDLVSHRVAEFTYGFEIWPKFDKSKHSIDRKIMVNGEERCRGVFLKIVTKGDPITPNLKKSLIFKPLEKKKNVHQCDVFVSNQINPTYVDDPGCAKLGIVQISLTKFERQINMEIELSITFGETDITVTAYNNKTQLEDEISFDFLSPEIHLPSNYIGSS